MKKRNRFNIIKNYFLKVLSFVGITLLALILTIYSTGLALSYGPSKNARDLFVLSLSETSAAKWVPRLFLKRSTINSILHRETDEEQPEQINPGLIVLPESNTSEEYDEASSYVSNSSTSAMPVDKDKIIVSEEGVTIVEVDGFTYHGEVMIIDDPSRVFVATLDEYGPESNGITLSSFINKYDAIGGINAGGFIDPNGTGTGGLPDGLVMGDSKIMWGSIDTTYNCVIGFDDNNLMHVGTFSGAMAIEKNIVSAVSFAPGPVLIVNGKPLNEDHQLGGGLNPRTAIGQRADGSILLLVVDGRQAQSLGATYDDLVDIMLEFGAVNAANLDGGSSSRMHYKGKHINECASIIGERGLPNAILIKKAGNKNAE